LILSAVFVFFVVASITDSCTRLKCLRELEELEHLEGLEFLKGLNHLKRVFVRTG